MNLKSGLYYRILAVRVFGFLWFSYFRDFGIFEMLAFDKFGILTYSRCWSIWDFDSFGISTNSKFWHILDFGVRGLTPFGISMFRDLVIFRFSVFWDIGLILKILVRYFGPFGISINSGFWPIWYFGLFHILAFGISRRTPVFIVSCGDFILKGKSIDTLTTCVRVRIYWHPTLYHLVYENWTCVFRGKGNITEKNVTLLTFYWIFILFYWYEQI